MQASVLAVGVAVMDLIMNVETMPRTAGKYRTGDASLTGGGGAANAAVAVTRLGGKSALATRLGQDLIGDMIVQDLTRETVDCNRVRRFASFRSSFSSIYIDRFGERQIVNFRDEDTPAEGSWLSEKGEHFDAHLADTRWPEGANWAMQIARRRGIPGILDAEPPFDGTNLAFEAASHVFFSADGLRCFTGVDDLAQGLTAARERISAVVGVTDGVNGVTWCRDQGRFHTPAFAVNTVDTLGAGDVWHGALALALAEQMPLRDAIVFASAAAALKCTRKGGRDGIPGRHDVDNFLLTNSIEIDESVGLRKAET